MFDTICAISTSLNESAINIIRISGEDAISTVNSILLGCDLTKKNGGTINYAKIVDENNNVIDEVLVSLFRAPKSYTKEDVIEINTHGGAFVTTKVLELLLSKGLRLALPGEFTKRAFLNGRIDLSQAEAVMDIINSETRDSLILSTRALNGEIKTLVESLRKDIEEILMHIDVNIDYPEYTDEVQVTNDICINKLSKLIPMIEDIIGHAEKLRVYKEGVKTIILGKPNVGKSSLLNKLLKEDKAIVTSYKGTTRDIVEGKINIGGIILNLIDTAGVRDTDDPIEKIGIEKTINALDKAELVLLLLDESNDLESEDYKLLELTKDKKRIIVGNKSDLGKRIKDTDISISALNGSNVELLEKKIRDMFVLDDIKSDNEKYVIASSRHIAILKKVLASLESANNASVRNDFLDMIYIDLMVAYDELGKIVGLEPSSLIDEIFKNFCLGK